MIVGIDARPLISDNPTGIGVYLARVLEVISSLDHNNSFILYTTGPLSRKYKFSDNFIERIIPGKVWTLWIRYSLPKVLLKDKVDVFWGTEHLLPRRNNKIKYILTIHDVAMIINPKWGKTFSTIMMNLLIPQSVRDADRIITVSDSTKNDLVKYLNVDKRRIQRIYLGRPTGKFNASNNQRKRFFLYMGTLEPRKNLENMIKAFNIVSSSEKDIKFIIAGGYGWKYKRIVEELEKSPYRDRIDYLGYVTNEKKQELISECLALMFVSHYEGFGLPILEAYENGTLVITARNSSLPEVGGKCAFYVEDENNPQEIADRMIEVLNLESERQDNIVAEEKKQLEEFSWENCGIETYKVIKEYLV